MKMRHPLRSAVLIGATVEFLLITPALLFGEAAVEAAPWLNWLQLPGASPVLWLFRHQQIKDIAQHFPRRVVVLVAQTSAVLIQTVLLGCLFIGAIYVWRGLSKRVAR